MAADEKIDQIKIGVEPGGEIYSQGDHQGVEEEDDAQEKKLDKIGRRQARGNDVGEEIGEGKQERRSPRKSGVAAEDQEE